MPTSLFDAAKAFAAVAEQRAARASVPISVSVVDIHGNLVLKHRMAAAPVISVEMSERKAYTSALLGVRTADLTEAAQPGQSMHTITSVAGGRFVAFGGGAPLRSEGRLVAGLGVSGGTTADDVEILEGALSDLGHLALGEIRDA